MYSQNYKYSNSREETKTNLTRTGQMAIAQSQNLLGILVQKNPFQLDFNQHSATGMNKGPNEQPEMSGIRGQLKLLKQKMSKPNEGTYQFENTLDQQTKSINDQLNSLNQKLIDKQQPTIPRNRNVDASPNQMSYKSTNNTNYSNQSKQIQPYDNQHISKQNNQASYGYNNMNQYQNSNNSYNNYQQAPNNYNYYNNNQNGNNQYQQKNPNSFNQNNFTNQSLEQPKNIAMYQQNNSLNYNPINYNLNRQIGGAQQYKQLSFQQQQQLKNELHNQPYQQQSSPFQQQATFKQSEQVNQQYNQQQYQPSVLTKQPPVKNRGGNLGSKNIIDEMPAVAQANQNKLQIPEYEDDQDGELIECPEGCGRQFRRQALQKHVKVCKQVFQSKREEFNSKEARLVNQEQAKLMKQGEQKEKVIQQRQKIQKKQTGEPKWKKQSEEFRKMIQAGRNGEAVEYQEINELIECPSCGRKFNENAAEKHIPSCKNKQKLNKIQQRR